MTLPREVAADLNGAVDLLLAAPPGTGTVSRVLVARLDSVGDVLLAGPAIRAVAHGRRPDGGAPNDVVVLCGRQGAPAASLLPGVAEVLRLGQPLDRETRPPGGRPRPGDPGRTLSPNSRITEAVILTSFHQSPLPLALLLRLAGVGRITGASTDYAGSLLDVRLRPGEDFPEDQPEAERALGIARAAGFTLPPGDDGKLKVQGYPDVRDLVGEEPYIVVHPGASAPARAWPALHHAAAVELLEGAGHRVVVTGGPNETKLTATVAGPSALDLGGRTDLRTLAGVLAGARVLVTGNTGPAHLAAARRNAGGVPVLAGGAGHPLGPLRRTAGNAGRPERALQAEPRHGLPRSRASLPVFGGSRTAGGGGGTADQRGGLPLHEAKGAPRMRILLWHVHGSWTDAFVRGRHEYLLPVLPDRGPWGLGRAGRDWPASVREVRLDALAADSVDAVVLQRPEELAEVARALGRRPGKDLPAVYVEHNTPKGGVPNSVHPLADQHAIPVVHVTHFNELFWDSGSAPTLVIEHGVADPGHLYTGEVPDLAAVVNEPVRRRRVTGTDLLGRFAAAAPLQVFGMGGDGLPQAPGCRRRG